MAAYAGTTTLMWNTVFGNKRVSLLKVAITNYNATGIPLTAVIAGVDAITVVIPFFFGGMANAQAPFNGSYVAADSKVYLYTAVNTPVADDTNIYTTLGITVYLLVIEV